MSFESSSLGRSALTLLALRSVGRLQGRTKVQKILFLANLCGWNSVRDYRYYYYGPYSDAITTEIEIFKRNGWINEESFETGEGRVAHSYALTQKGERVADSLAAKINNTKLVQKTMSMIKELHQFSSDDLEIMATLVFLRRNEPSLSDDDLLRRLLELKPRFPEDRIRDDMKIFNILKNFGYGDRLKPNS